MISNFVRDEASGAVEWESNGTKFKKEFKGKIQAELISNQNRVLVVCGSKGSRPRNLWIFDEQGQTLANPPMPNLDEEVHGVYAVWYIPEAEIQKTILLTDAFAPYDTACDFNLSSFEFSNFRRSK